MTATISPGSTHKDDTRLQPVFPIERLETAVGYGFRLRRLPMVTFLCITPSLAAETRLMMSQLSSYTKPLLGKAQLPYWTTWSPVTCSTTATSITAHFKPRYLWLSGPLFPITGSFCNISVRGKTNRGMRKKSLHRGVEEGDRENSIWWIWCHYKGLALRIIAKRIPGKHWKIQLKFVFISGIKGLILRNEPKLEGHIETGFPNESRTAITSSHPPCALHAKSHTPGTLPPISHHVIGSWHVTMMLTSENSTRMTTSSARCMLMHWAGGLDGFLFSIRVNHKWLGEEGSNNYEQN